MIVAINRHAQNKRERKNVTKCYNDIAFEAYLIC